MSVPPAALAHRASDLRILARCRLLQLRNLVDQQLREAPWRTLAALTLLVLIWVALYFLLLMILRHVRSWGMVAIIANQHIFVLFFLFLAIMLAFSNALLTFSTLYGRSEAGHLLSLPVNPRQIVCVKWLEGMALSSWSFLLLGVPVMLAIAQDESVGWWFYPLFMGHFLAFIAIPACLGLLAAWAVAMFAPRRPMTIAVVVGALLLAAGAWWFASVSRSVDEPQQWIRNVFQQLGIAQQPLLPSTWTARGIVAAVRGDVSGSLFYLMVVVGNALFVSWLTVNLLGRTWAEAYSRSVRGRSSPVIARGWVTELLCMPAALFLPYRLRMILVKDLRYFVRDPKQWTQTVILFGLLLLYVINLRRLKLDFAHPGAKSLMAFFNLTTVSLILATFTSRFVFPLVSLESQQLWLLELLPLRRVTLLLTKFIFAAALSTLSACGVMGLAVYMLELSPLWAAINMAICLSICLGLSGLAIGLGARFPVLGQRNPARIASGFGGTFNLIASMLFVTLEMFGVALLSLTETAGEARLAPPDSLSRDGWAIVVGLVLLGLVVAAGALAIGAAHFRRLET